MTRTLLLRGMLVGVVAGLLVFAFARWIGEPQVERAIAFETAADQAKGEAPELEMVSRRVQKSFGLLTGTVVYGAAVGGLFGLVFALAYGRIGELGPRALSAVLAGLGFVAIVLVPQLKYPANPPAVGSAETIGVRTGAYFLLIAVSIAAMVFSLQMRKRLARRFGEWNGSLLAAALFVVVVSLVAHFLPVVDEVPAGFPVTLMWKFRVAAVEIQAVLWGTLGLGLGWWMERELGLGRIPK
ncbi:CbtA family protein [Tunturibacter empetritectus]|uniref:Cobalt transporter CbtA n=1 Tax=Tunturiibacter empetritectus TaxID=3069691 RepID=A0A7W8IF11_9BACT|nr:CbtA family protein [Edaphobacter lichenicola]MBB5315962.1 putative cobalt transporter CbtA [Edaphobacter lichenicola]